jgi:hypothetical protein
MNQEHGQVTGRKDVFIRCNLGQGEELKQVTPKYCTVLTVLYLTHKRWS